MPSTHRQTFSSHANCLSSRYPVVESVPAAPPPPSTVCIVCTHVTHSHDARGLSQYLVAVLVSPLPRGGMGWPGSSLRSSSYPGGKSLTSGGQGLSPDVSSGVVWRCHVVVNGATEMNIKLKENDRLVVITGLPRLHELYFIQDKLYIPF